MRAKRKKGLAIRLKPNQLMILKKKMLEFAENLNFEKAAELRDKIKLIEKKQIGINENV